MYKFKKRLKVETKPSTVRRLFISPPTNQREEIKVKSLLIDEGTLSYTY